jgi:hypothetical protein
VKKLLNVNFDVQFLPILSFDPAIMADKPHIEIFNKLLSCLLTIQTAKLLRISIYIYCLY